MVLLVLAVVLLLVAGAALVMAARLHSTGSGPAVVERQRRLRFRLAVPSAVVGLVLVVISRLVGS